jgi:LmbE family N-acetylglucosaminyl deacetylase
MASVLCVVAHPDDESFSMGGTIVWHTKRGDQVTVIALSDGESSRGVADSVGKKRRWRQFTAACQVLGANPASCSLFEDQLSDAMPQLELNRKVQRVIDEYPAERVYTHCTSDLNHDHRRVAEAVLVGTRGRCPVYGCEPEWPGRCIGTPFAPTTFQNITPYITRKLDACRKYRGEMRSYPHPRSVQALKERARRHSPSAGCYDEAFVVYE